MNVNSIFGLNDANRVRVPEIEVQGDRLRVQQDPPERDVDVQGDRRRVQQNLQEQDVEEREPAPENRTYRLPKTKWF